MYAFYLLTTRLKNVSSMKIHCDLNVTQKTAWHMAHRIRKTWEATSTDKVFGTLRVDETYVGSVSTGSFWSMLRRGHMGTYHKMSRKHVGRYVTKFAGRYHDREYDTLDQMELMARDTEGRVLRYNDLREGR